MQFSFLPQSVEGKMFTIHHSPIINIISISSADGKRALNQKAFPSPCILHIHTTIRMILHISMIRIFVPAINEKRFHATCNHCQSQKSEKWREEDWKSWFDAEVWASPAFLQPKITQSSLPPPPPPPIPINSQFDKWHSWQTFSFIMSIRPLVLWTILHLNHAVAFKSNGENTWSLFKCPMQGGGGRRRKQGNIALLILRRHPLRKGPG